MAKRRFIKCWKACCLSVPEAEDTVAPIYYSALFKYATAYEKIAIVFASFLAIFSGCVPPVINILYGEYCNLMIDRQFPTHAPSTEVFVLPHFGGGKILHNASVDERKEALKDDSQAWGAAAGLLTAALFLLCNASIYLLCLTSSRQISRIKVLYFKSILCKDLTWFDTNMRGNFAGQATENLLLMEKGMSDVLSVFIFHLTVGLLNIFISFSYGWMLAVTLLAIISPVVLCAFYLARYQNKLEVEAAKAALKADSVAEEAFTAIKTVVAFGGEIKEINRYSSSLKQGKKCDIKKTIACGISNGLVWFALYCSYSAAFALGVRLIEFSTDDNHQGYTPAVLLITFFGIVSALMSLGYATQKLGVFSSACISAAIVFDIITEVSVINPCSDLGARELESHGEVEFKQVYFEYPARPGVLVFNEFNLKIKAGQTVAIVGESGSGKTTLVQLLLRLYDPVKGAVFIDGRDIKSLNVAWLRSQFGVVDEQPVLFNTTIRDNISYGNMSATDDEIKNAAKLAHAHDFVMQFKEGFNTEAGLLGSKLSLGQRQRIAIARVLVGDPKIVILDDALRNLDITTEAELRLELTKFTAGRTTFIITPRLSTITHADRIIVLSKGTIIEDGTHNELMRANGMYKHFYLTEGEEIYKDTRRKQTPPLYSAGSPISFKDATLLPPGPRGRLNSITGVPRTSTSDTPPGAERIKDVHFSEIVRWTRPEWFYFLIGSVASICSGITLPVLGVLYGDLLGFLSQRNFSFIKSQTDTYAVVLVAIGAATGICIYAQLHCFGIAAAKLSSRLRIKTFRCLIYQEIAFFEDESNTVGALCVKLSRDAGGIQNAFDIRLGILIQAITAMAIGIILSFVYNPKITLVTLTTIPFLFSGVYVESIFASGLLSVENKAMEKASKIAAEITASIKTVATLTRESMFVHKYEEAVKEGQRHNNQRFWLRSFAFALGQAAPYFGYTLTLWYGGVLMAEEGVHYMDVIKITELLIFGTWTLGQSLVFGPSIRETRASAGRLQYIFTRNPKVVDGLSDLPPDMNTKSINFSKVHFAYPTSDFALQNFNLRIDPGRRTAVMGTSGSGKSSIIPLLLRFYDPISGTIAIGRTNIRACKLTALRKKFGVVSQRADLFDRTIEENIAYGDNTRTVTIAEVMDAAKAANIHSFIVTLPNGYGTKLGPTLQLSGGQKQRIAIARILVRNPAVLLLDEATAGLDPENEAVVQTALDEAARERTTLTIAHRMSAIRNVDMIYVIDKGTVKEAGTREELMQHKGLFYSMHGNEE